MSASELDFDLEYRCGSCDELHRGLPAWGTRYPDPYLQASWLRRLRARCSEDTCALGADRFARGSIELPIVGSQHVFSWGVWV
jgi:hypothetical protein